MKHTVLDMKALDPDVGALEMIKPPQITFKVVVEMDKKMDKQAAKDPLLLQEFHNAAKQQLDDTKKMVQKKCRQFDKLFVDMAAKGADKKMMEKQMKGFNDALKNDFKVAEKAAELAVLKAWKDFVAKKKEWTKFKVKVGVSIFGSVASFFVSLGMMVSAPFTGGASGALSIIGLVKSVISVGKDIAKLAGDIDFHANALKKHCAFVEATAQKKGLFGTNEVAAAVLNEFIGIAQPSIKSVQDEAETLKAKYAQLVVKVHSASKDLDKLLKLQKKLEKDFLSEASKRLKKHPTKDKAGQLKKIKANFDKALAKSAQQVDASISKVSTMFASLKPWAAQVKTLTARAEKLDAKDTKALKVFREGLKVISLAGAALDGNKIVDNANDLCVNLAEAGAGYAYDKISSLALDGTVLDAA